LEFRTELAEITVGSDLRGGHDGTASRRTLGFEVELQRRGFIAMLSIR
jgi:hypothetical protein